jgi:hypothetical protein
MKEFILLGIGVIALCSATGLLTFGITQDNLQKRIWDLEQTIRDRDAQIQAMNQNDSTHAACWNEHDKH